MDRTGGSAITKEIRGVLGVEVGPHIYKIEEWMIQRFADVVGDLNPLWRDKTSAEKTGYRNVIASPTFVANFCRLIEQDDWVLSVPCPLPRALAGGCEIENFKPVMPEDMISVTGKLVDVQEKKGKAGKLLLLIFERVYKNQRREIVTKTRRTIIRY